MVEKSGKSYTVKGEVGLSGLSPESRLYVELSDEGHAMCLALEAAIAAEEQRSSRKVPFFPVTIGRWGAAGARVPFLLPSLYLRRVSPASPGGRPTPAPRPRRPTRCPPRRLRPRRCHRSLLQ